MRLLIRGAPKTPTGLVSVILVVLTAVEGVLLGWPLHSFRVFFLFHNGDSLPD